MSDAAAVAAVSCCGDEMSLTHQRIMKTIVVDVSFLRR